MKATDQEIKNIMSIIREQKRLSSLSPDDLIRECLKSDAADFMIVEELMNRVRPGWEDEKTGI